MNKPKYPVPIRPRWSTLIEFRDGQHIAGADDVCAVDAWRRMHWLTPVEDPAHDREMFKQRILEHARGIYGAELPDVSGLTPDAEWLDALDAAGVITVIRK